MAGPLIAGGVFAHVCLMWRHGIEQGTCGAVGVVVAKLKIGGSGVLSPFERTCFVGCHERFGSSTGSHGRAAYVCCRCCMCVSDVVCSRACRHLMHSLMTAVLWYVGESSGMMLCVGNKW